MHRPPPPNLLARPAEARDYTDFLRAVAELGVDDPPPSRARWIEAELPTTLCFEIDGKFAAYAYFQLLANTGYIRNLVVEPELRGRGIGRAVLQTLREHFQAAGCTAWCLNVKPTNVAAIRIYEAAGLSAAYRAFALRLAWRDVPRLPPPDPDWSVQPLVAAEDDALELQFGLDRGMLAARRARPDAQLIALWSRLPNEPALGLACFEPHLPGASPFEALSPAAARALLSALQPLAAGQEELTTVVRDAALGRALIEAGARLALEVVHYRSTF